MMNFSRDPNLAEQQMNAVIFYMVAFGYIDGDFDQSERVYIKDTIRKMVESRASTVLSDQNPAKTNIINRFTKHFNETFEQTDQMIVSWQSEVVAKDENNQEFVLAKLRLKSFEIFKKFDLKNQRALLATVDELIRADGKIHPEEKKFRDEIELLLLETKDDVDIPVNFEANNIAIEHMGTLLSTQDDHPFFDSEEHYSIEPTKIRTQSQLDKDLICNVMDLIAAKQQRGKGKLTGKKSVGELKETSAFWDQHVIWQPIKKNTNYECIVLGDLHGCYSCLKAALLQSNFFSKVEAYKNDPINNPNPQLILLGDYIDRGRFSYNGVLRTVMQLFLAAPEHVIPLRGNHEYYVEFKGRIYGGVKPAEAINSLVGHMPDSMFVLYMKLFESLPNALLFGQHLFVHAGIPRDSAIKSRWKDLSSLNDPGIRFQMLWSDPAEVDRVPDELQAQNARFPFGKKQFESFMNLLGTHSMIRGHEKHLEGFKTTYNDSPYKLLNIFSSGGEFNEDVPKDSSYRNVTPMALTMHVNRDETRVLPWKIDYQRFNSPKRNRFFASPPEIMHKA